MTIHQKQSIQIAVVGDIHQLWEPEDAIALEQLGVDLVLFVGDFGNEAVDIVQMIAAIDLPKAVIMGNHDAWYTASEWGRKKSPYDHEVEDRVQQQLDLLGSTHVGYGYLDFPDLNLSVVGARPYSWGGQTWRNKKFYREQYGINSFSESVERILAAVRSAAYETVILIGHNGPTGLGDQAEAPCGKDWYPAGGDHGDPDLEDAIAKTYSLGKNIPLVTFGHMHHILKHTKDRLRTMIVTSPEGTVYLNAASVPRIIETDTDRLRNFSIVSLKGGIVDQVSLVWVGKDYSVVSEELLYQASEALLV
ncbi:MULTISPECIES: TIGR04168 family protein [unclassified Moorena]|uniref:TIGR04168 family protein n=1 Tax=unclassified Moorena TaxID=2683338 RepID=UPI0013CD09ED|nr:MULTISPECIES: TIGR04168 family protein [unclassified Moorena]NEO20186.1 TIGR04168 family protein [Moorena sp. SIO4A5]NEQ59366.1 TIGR04168 family protein [Moorena sp. SIO4A1]